MYKFIGEVPTLRQIAMIHLCRTCSPQWLVTETSLFDSIAMDQTRPCLSPCILPFRLLVSKRPFVLAHTLTSSRISSRFSEPHILHGSIRSMFWMVITRRTLWSEAKPRGHEMLYCITLIFSLMSPSFHHSYKRYQHQRVGPMRRHTAVRTVHAPSSFTLDIKMYVNLLLLRPYQ